MRKVAVLGMGHSQFCFNSPKTQVELLSEVSLDAITSSNLTTKDIEAAFIGNALGTIAEGQATVQQFFANDIGCLNIPALRYEGACASGTIAIREAFMNVAAGYYDVVLVAGVDKTTGIGTPLATRCFSMAGDSRYEFPCGYTFPSAFALLAHLYASHYNIPLPRLKEQMAAVSVQSHFYASKNPLAQLRFEITVEDVLNSFMVSTPIQLHDCCPFTDGAAAVVLASEEVARKIYDKPCWITGVGLATSGRLSSQYRYLPRIRARELSVEKAYKMAGIGPEDVDVCELHDCFSIASIIAAESLGFFEFGTAGEAWLRGETKIDGKIPINVSGGLKAKGHPIGATGVSQLYHICKQLRNEMVDYGLQVEGARTGLVDTLGGDGCLCHLVVQS
ncbi:MAG TPA: beta-ketoacyl synthase N-terminal-like domain-containing protein [Syntrophomonadaceae bacterium]|nr:beta-ketoacyl synthase N-terminal-like domain-containing protein [Syntrophomonadaceae bacterium]HQD90295.1 beta-ketoacyl synthase N-terminal-like domain-containing protein [Syntrophomonadaceae bacterium]